MASSHSCDVFVVTGEKEEIFFAVHLPHSGGTNGVCYALFDFLDDKQMPGKLSQLISETCSKENDFDFLYEAWKPEDRTYVFILDILYDKLNERLNGKPKEELKNPQRQDQAVYDLETRKEGRGDWKYVINLEKEIITTKYKHHDRDVFSFDEVGKYLPNNIKSCDVLVSSEKERFFAVHLPHSGGHAVRQALLDFLKHREKFEKLKRLISEARSKEDNFDFLYQGWDKSDRTNTHILQILCTKLDEKIKNLQRRENAVSNLQLRKEGRGDWQYDIDLDYEVIRSTYGRQSIKWKFKDIDFFLRMEAESNDQNERYSARIISEMGERDRTLDKHNDGGCTAPSRYGYNTRVRGDTSSDLDFDDEAESTTDLDQDLAPTDDSAKCSPAKGTTLIAREGADSIAFDTSSNESANSNKGTETQSIIDWRYSEGSNKSWKNIDIDDLTRGINAIENLDPLKRLLEDMRQGIRNRSYDR